MDLKAAFDSLDHEILFKKMLAHGIQEPLIDAVRFLYSNVHTQVDKETAPIPINKGVL